jgi:non-ribosomal peptide synthetase component F
LEGTDSWNVYATDLFEQDTIQRMGGRLLRVLEAVAGKVDLRLADIPLLTEEEEAQLRAWNATAAERVPHKCVQELFEEQVERTPEAAAVVCGDVRLSYTELNGRANRLARYLRDSGVGPEVSVGVCLERSVEMVVSSEESQFFAQELVSKQPLTETS